MKSKRKGAKIRARRIAKAVRERQEFDNAEYGLHGRWREEWVKQKEQQRGGNHTDEYLGLDNYSNTQPTTCYHNTGVRLLCDQRK